MEEMETIMKNSKDTTDTAEQMQESPTDTSLH